MPPQIQTYSNVKIRTSLWNFLFLFVVSKPLWVSPSLHTFLSVNKHDFRCTLHSARYFITRASLPSTCFYAETALLISYDRLLAMTDLFIYQLELRWFTIILSHSGIILPPAGELLSCRGSLKVSLLSVLNATGLGNKF